MITVDPESKHGDNPPPPQHKGKEKAVKPAEERVVISDSSSDEAHSGRKQHSKPSKPRRASIDRYEEEVIKLKRMTSEEKELVKALIKLTTQKVPSLHIIFIFCIFSYSIYFSFLSFFLY